MMQIFGLYFDHFVMFAWFGIKLDFEVSQKNYVETSNVNINFCI